jgi:predicted dehydrogenase
MSANLRAILVGCGRMSGEWIQCAQELGVELVALVDVYPKAAEDRAREFSLSAKTYASLETALQEVAADVLFDCTVPAAHPEVSAAAMRAGLHVLEEKPLALSLGEARQLVSLSSELQRVHVIMQNRRFNRGARILRQMITDRIIGDLTTVHVDFFVAPHFGGFREQMSHVLLADMAIHPFDVARYLTGKNGVSVYCDDWNPAGSWYAAGASVVAAFHLESDIRFSYRGSWCAQGFRTSWDAVWRLIGTEGTLFWDGADDVRAERVERKGAFLDDPETIRPSAEPDPASVRGHYSVMRQFLADVRGGIPAETRSADNIHSLAMVIGAIESAESGNRVEIRV